MTDDLASRTCTPCRGDVAPLTEARLQPLLAQLTGWDCVDGHHLVKRFAFPDFRRALAFVNRVGHVAEAQDHHPELGFGWGWVAVTIWTHKIDGLSENDFVLAARCDAVTQAEETQAD